MTDAKTLDLEIRGFNRAVQDIKQAPAYIVRQEVAEANGTHLPPQAKAPDLTPEDIPPPVKGGRAYADDIPEWDVRMTVDVKPGAWHQDYAPAQPAAYQPDASGAPQLVSPAIPPRPLGTWRCVGFDMTWDGNPPVLADAGPATPASLTITGKPLDMADSVWKHWLAGSVGTLPSRDGTTYVGIPTCAWIEGSTRPNQAINIPSKSEVTGHALRGPVTITEYINVNVSPEAMQWSFDDPDGTPSGFEAGRGNPPSALPHYDASSQTWPTPQRYCQVFHQYARVRDHIAIHASQWYDFKITGYFNNGAGKTDLVPVVYRLEARWDAPPMHVYQIEAVPFVP